jgi:hypothetical protein
MKICFANLTIVSIIMLSLAMLVATANPNKNSYVAYYMCGNNPFLKYKELAKAIGKILYKYHIFSITNKYLIMKKYSLGWEYSELLTFIKLEKPDEYNELIKSIKSYMECLEMMLHRSR